ncbi:MAG: helix-turn-helix transcriptional regulator [Chloroflexi bacterium]|nr:helix-turn-helix transcriptional regulator [Chloroflexota bacterium]MBV9896630.1 helix-turn-helix transcriptional regulator [Chloroflexota bacterium]
MMSDDPPGGTRRFAGWLEASMRTRGFTQAQLARSVGVADTQVSRWRRGQVVPTLQYLQRLADTFGVERITLDELVGLPVAQARGERASDPEQEAELQAYQARFKEVLQTKLPRGMWRAYLEACVALADGLSASARRVVRQSIDDLERSQPDEPPERPLGFHP